MSARAKMSTQPTAGHPLQSQQRRQAMLGENVGATVAPSQRCDRQDDRRRFPLAKKRVPLVHSTNDPAELPARSPLAKCPAPAAASTNSNSSLLSSKTIGRAGRCADAPATCGSCARRRGGDGVAGSSNRHFSLPSCAFLPSCIREIRLEAVTRCFSSQT